MKLLADALNNTLREMVDGVTPLHENTGQFLTIGQDAVARFTARLRDDHYSERGIDERIAIGGTSCQRLVSACESPIEATMCGPLVFAHYDGFEAVPALACLASDALAPPADVFIIPQFAFVRFRADFAVVGVCGPARKYVLLECDGKDFHKDIAKDRARDAFFTSHGMDVVRASGREIYDNPIGVAALVATHLSLWRASLGA